MDELRGAWGQIGEFWQARTRSAVLEPELSRSEAERAALEGENAFLRTTLSLGLATTSRVVLARVVATRPPLLRQTLIVDKGAAEDAEVGMLAFAAPNRFVGRVIEVRSETSVVETLFHPKSRVVGETELGGIKGVAQGRFGTGVVFWGLAQAGVPAAGSRVVTTGATAMAGLVLGELGEVGHEAGETRFQAPLHPAVDRVPEFVFLFRP